MDTSPPRHRLAPIVPPAEGLTVEQDEIVFASRFAMQRVRFRYTRFDGALSGPLTWELWRRGRGVVVLPYDPATDRVALIEQFRLPAHAAGCAGVQVELPAGLLEPEEDPALAGRRELAEEAGLEARALEPIGRFLLMPGGCDELVWFYCAHVALPEGMAGTHGMDHENEDTRLMVLPAESAFAMIGQRGLDGAPTVLALQWLRLNRARLRAEWTRA
jgi:ADP-ribose pyrophosphatase